MIQGKKGAALPLVIMIMVVVTILGITLLTISLAEARQVAYYDNRMQAYYIARSGAEALMQHIIKNPNEVTTIASNTSTSQLASGSLAGGDFEMNVTDVQSNTNVIRIDSTGSYNTWDKKVSVTLVKKTPSEIFKRAIFSNNDLDISNMKVTGEIESVGTIQYSTNGSNTYTGKAYPNSTEYYPEPVSPSLPLSMTPVIVAKKETVALTPGNRYTSVTADQNGKITIAAHGAISKLVFDTLVIDNSLDIITSGGGRVEIYITNSMVLTTKGVINNDTPEKLVIFLAQGSKLEMQSGKILNSYIYGPNATVQIQSNHSLTNGAIIANVVTKNNQGNGPNGVMNYVPIGSTYNQFDAIRAYKVDQWSE